MKGIVDKSIWLYSFKERGARYLKGTLPEGLGLKLNELKKPNVKFR